MSHTDQACAEGATATQNEESDVECRTFSILDDAVQLAQARVNCANRRHQQVDDIVRMVEEKRDVIQLAAAGTQRLAAMNQLSAANLGMLACNATAIGHTIGSTFRTISDQNQTIRKTTVAQSAATCALSLHAANAQDEIDHLAMAMASLAANASELLTSLAVSGLAGPVHTDKLSTDTQGYPASATGMTVERSDAEPARIDFGMTIALAEQTAVVARHMSDRVAALSATFQRFTAHCADIQRMSEELCGDVEYLNAHDDELEKSKVLITSLVQQIEVMVPPLRQIAVSCTGVTKNLNLTAEGLDIIRNRIFVRPEDGLAYGATG